MMMRYGTAITGGTLVTLALFWLMTTLISLHHGKPLPPRDRDALDFYRMTPEEPVVPERERLFRELTQPVDTPPARPNNLDSHDGTGIRPMLARAPTPELGKPTLSGQHDGPLVAMVRVQPVYPARLVTRNLEGWVIVQFDVNPDGTVSNATVVESSHPAFEKSAVDAALKFRYKARVVNGVAQATTGLQNIFRFEMERT